MLKLTFHFTYLYCILFCCVISQQSLFAQQGQSIIILDDFEGTTEFPFNNYNAIIMAFADTLGSDISLSAPMDNNTYCQTGRSLKVNYALTAESDGSCGFVSMMPLIDLTNYQYLSFRIKGSAGLDMVQVEMGRENGEKSKLSIWDFISCGTNTEWRKVVIPLDNFWSLQQRTSIEKLVITFDQNAALANGSPLTGEVYFDDFLFGTYFPGYLKIDSFNDNYSPNSTGGNNGNFSPSGDTIPPISYSSELSCSEFPINDCDCYLKLNYNNEGSDDDFGGYFTILGGDSTGWIGIEKDISAYDTFYLETHALTSSTNPGNFKIELKGYQVNSYRISGVNLDDQYYSIPFSAFTPQPFNPSGINELAIIFEKNLQLNPVGNVIIDELELRAEGYTLPDISAPATPENVLLNGNMPTPSNILQEGAAFIVSAEVNNSDPRLESVRLEYKLDCGWVCVERLFAPINSSPLMFQVIPGEIPENTWLEMRIVAENYNGIKASTTPFLLKTGEDTPSILPEEILRNAYSLFEYLRYEENGVYIDAANFGDMQFHPASVATTGMGLIALCIADTMGWINNAEKLALETLISMNGLRPGFNPERNSCGWFRHFINQSNGEQAWDSEFSSIDSGILTAGALFCKKYFSTNDSIAQLADCLFYSTDWESMIADPETGGIYLTANEDCVGGWQTLPFNEYMIVAWLAKNDYRQTGIAELLWNQYYENPSNLLTADFMGIPVLTDVVDEFVSGFVHQFPYYLCHHYASDPEYLAYFENAMRADSLWWAKNRECNDYIWGFGAGSANDWDENGYQADKIHDHPGTICSPHIIGGFIPVNPEGLNHLIQLHNTPLGLYELPDAESTPILWRFSTEQPSWRAGDIQGVDHSTLLFGGVSHPDFLGSSFFEYLNDFDFPTDVVDCPISSSTTIELSSTKMGQNFPNPLHDFTIIPFSLKKGHTIQLKIYDTHGNIVFAHHFGYLDKGDYKFRWSKNDVSDIRIPPGVYYYSIIDEYSSVLTKKMIVFD